MSGRRHACVALAIAAGLAGCSTASTRPSAQPSPSPSAGSATAGTSPTTGSDHTVWLCRPGRNPDPCVRDQGATAILADGSHRPVPVVPDDPRADCFYVYPTVSQEHGRNADLKVQKAETDVAFAQASRFSSVCRVWAPMYRQRTTSDLFNLNDVPITSRANRIAYASLLSGWRAFLREHDPHLPIVLIGHSQGAAMLIRLIGREIDNNAALRSRLALAIVLGGNVTVATGHTTGGSFTHVPLCTRRAQTGCVIAYSSFPSQPPAAALFGRPGVGVSLLSGEHGGNGLSVACVNPAGIGGGRAPLHPYIPTALVQSGVLTPWSTYPDRYTSQCRHGGGATWLQVSPTHIPNDVRPVLPEQLGSLWGYHVIDLNVALDDLVNDVGASTATWVRHHH